MPFLPFLKSSETPVLPYLHTIQRISTFFGLGNFWLSRNRRNFRYYPTYVLSRESVHEMNKSFYNYCAWREDNRSRSTPAFCHLLECAEIGEFYLSLTPHTLCSKIHCSFYLEEPGQGGQPNQDKVVTPSVSESVSQSVRAKLPYKPGHKQHRGISNIH